jgi:uncharacterized membrane protein
MTEEKNNLEQITESLNQVINAVNSLNEKISKQEERLNNLEGSNVVRKENSSFLAQEFGNSIPPPAPLASTSSPKETFQPTPAKKEGNLEENIGGKLFAKIGIAALVLGVSFFLKYAFDQGWIGETGRVIIGIIIGVSLLVIGEKTIRKYSLYGQITSGGGIAILYLSIFAAYSFYGLIGQLPAFFFMMIITAIGIILSLRYDAISLIMVSTVGGFFTPILISSGENNQFGLFSYILLLDLAILVISIFKKWRWLNVVGFVGTLIIFEAWAERFYSEEQLFSTMFFLTLFFVVYSISSLIYNLVKKEKSTGTEQLLTVFSATVYFIASYGIMNGNYHSFMGFFAVILAIYYFLWAYLTKEMTPEDENLYNFLAFLTVGFVTLAIPIQFEQNVITIGWIIEAMVLILLGQKTMKESIITFGTVVFTLAFMRLIFVDTGMHIENYMFLFNKIFFTFVAAIAASYFMAYISRGFEASGNFIKKGSIVILFVVVANFLTIFSISREIVVYYENQMNILGEKQAKAVEDMQKYGNSDFPQMSSKQKANSQSSARKNYYNSSEYKLSQEKMDSLKNKSSVTLSIFWLIYGIILMVVGIFGKYKEVRIGGMILLLLAILKLFFYDLWNLGTLYRIISAISLGVVLLSISFAYQKYKDKIKEII